MFCPQCGTQMAEPKVRNADARGRHCRRCGVPRPQARRILAERRGAAARCAERIAQRERDKRTSHCRYEGDMEDPRNTTRRY